MWLGDKELCYVQSPDFSHSTSGLTANLRVFKLGILAYACRSCPQEAGVGSLRLAWDAMVNSWPASASETVRSQLGMERGRERGQNWRRRGIAGW